MATVVVTFFLFVRFYVCKMDADCIEKQRDQLSSLREKRWSMNSQRLEEIVAELMKPISDARRSFDTDLSALLEEYLTEAGLRALDAGEDSSAADVVAPNFAELALLLQQSADIYGRKVDFLYQHVLDVSDSLHTSTQEPGDATEPGATPHARRRRRRASTLAGDEFAHIELQACAAATRDAAPRPPPTLPRMYIELEPRVLTGADAPLLDYEGEPIGLLADFQVTWRLHKGQLVDELEDGTSSEERALRPISLVELQAAIEAAAPPLPPPDEPPPSPLRTSTPLPPDTPDHDTSAVTDASVEPNITDVSANSILPTPTKKERKRRSLVSIDDIIEGSIKIVINEELRLKLTEVREFSIPTSWIKKVVKRRKCHILSERRRLREQESDPRAEFTGWSGAEAAEATAAVTKACGRTGEPDSDDDGFFEQSSVGESDASRAEEGAARAGDGAGDWAAWQARVVARAAAAEARGGLDVRALGRAVLAGLAGRAGRAGLAAPSPPAAPHTPVPFSDVLRRSVADGAEVSHVLLATLFLANAGNVEVLPGAALSLDSFSLQLRSADARLFGAAADDDQFLR